MSGRAGLTSIVFALLAFALSTGPRAVADEGDCTTLKWSVEREITLLTSAQLLNKPSGFSSPSGSDIGVSLQLVPVGEAKYELIPERKPKADAPFGGVLVIEKLEAGRYHVTLSGEAWIDVVQNGAFVASTDHTSAKACAQIRKSVEFLIADGPVTIQLSSAATSSIKVAVVKAD